MIHFELLKEIREDNDLKQKDMATILNTNRSTYASWETGVLIPVENLFYFAKYFNYSIDYCLGITKNREQFLSDKEFNKVNLGKNLKYLRESKNLSQRGLGIKLSVSHTAIQKYEKGDINILKLFDYSNYFHITMHNLIIGNF